MSVIKGTKISSHAKYLFQIWFGTENLALALCASSASRHPRGTDGAALASTSAASHACEEDPIFLH